MGTDLWVRERKFVHGPLHHMMQRGVKVDVGFCRRKIAEGEAAMNQIVRELKGRKPSGNNLKTMLLDELELPVLKWTDGGQSGKRRPSFTKEVLEEYDEILQHRNNPLAKQIAAYRGWQKTVSTNYVPYVKLLSPDGRLRCNYRATGTRTTRLSCADPNLQNIPKFNDKAPQAWNWDVKKGFVAQEGYVLVEVDCAQLEFRLGAAYSEENALLEAFNDPERDVFDEMAEALGHPRFQIKVKVYAGNYGAQPKKIAAILGIPVEASYALHRAYITEYPRLFAKSEEVNRVAGRRGYIKYWTGRRRHFTYPGEARKGFNSLMQGGGAEYVKSLMIELYDRVDNPDCRMLLQIHDSVVFEVRERDLDEHIERIVDVMSDVESATRGFPGAHILQRVKFPVEAKLWGT